MGNEFDLMSERFGKGVAWWQWAWARMDAVVFVVVFFFSSRRRHTRFDCDWSSDVCSSDLVFLEHPDRIALAPLLEQRRGEGVARLALVVGRVPSHPERLGDEQRRSLPPAAAVGRELGRRIRVEHVVAVELGADDAIARRPLVEVAGQVMLLEPGAEGDRKSTRLNSSHSQISYAVF